MVCSALFSGEASARKIKVLDGGERARVALCKLLLEQVNLLVMDETTNHLDMMSKDILKKALNNYDGTLIIVSHDRDFLQGLTEKVYEFKEKNIKEHLGDINAFLDAKKVEDFKEFELRKEKVAKEKTVSNNQISYEERKQLDKDIKKASNKVSRLERSVEELELLLKDLNVQLSDSEKYKELTKNTDFYANYEKKQQELAQNMKDWEDSIERLEVLKTKKEQL